MSDLILTPGLQLHPLLLQQLETFPFTKQQRKALLTQWAFLTSNPNQPGSFNPGPFLVQGCAGTGKSTTVFALVPALQAMGKRIVMTAPTNKAVDVLRRIAGRQKIRNVQFMTVHKLLGLGMSRDRQGKKVLAKVKASLDHLFDVVVIDEGSMTDKGLWQAILNLSGVFEETYSFYNTPPKVILMGDRYQLPPVGERRSQVFSIRRPNRSILTQVVRQNPGPLLEAVTAVRMQMQDMEKRGADGKKRIRPVNLPFLNDGNEGVGNEGVFAVGQLALLEYAKEKAAQFHEDPYGFRIFCWTNDQVDWYNARIRRHLYGKGAPAFVPGERLIARNTIFAPDGKTALFDNSDEFVVVEEAEEAMHHGYRSWRVVVGFEEGISLKEIYVLHEAEQERFDEELERMAKMARRNGALWQNYYAMKDTWFASVRGCFAQTVHTGQGTTVHEVGLDLKNIKRRLHKREPGEPRSRGISEFNSLVYTGATRGETKAIVAV